MPPWLNVSVGVFLLLIGVLFSLSSHKGFPGWEYAIILLGYLGLSGYYLSKGFRQYRARKGP